MNAPKSGLGAVGLLAAAALLAAGCSSTVADNTSQRGAVNDSVGEGSAPYVVGIGDSYMSGEGAIVSNKNYGSSQADWTFWVTGTLGQVFGDNNGAETIDYCHRSYSAPMHFGVANYRSVNLACSGAKTSTFTSDGKYKPGIDFDAGSGGSAQGQAALLQDFATDNDVAAVLLSIGGNDFNFAEIVAQAAEAYVVPTAWEPWRHNETGEVAVRQANLDKVSAGITQSIVNVQTAMANAGKAPDSYSLIYAAPPMFIGNSDDNRYWGSGSFYSRQNRGGCGINNKTLDWMNGKTMKTGGITGSKYTVPGGAPSLMSAMTKGVQDALPSLNGTSLTFVDSTDAFVGHQLCSKSVTPQADYQSKVGMESGLAGSLDTPEQPPWQDNNGKKNEWVTPMEIFGVQKGGSMADPVLEKAVGSAEHAKQLPFHPNYWGQRALASCYAQAVELAATQSQRTTCLSAGDQLDDAGRPAMQLSGTNPLG